MEDDDVRPNRVLQFAENHPYILLAAVVILVILLIMTYLNGWGWTIRGVMKPCKKKKKNNVLDDEEEMDELIKSIHSKQKKRKCAS